MIDYVPFNENEMAKWLMSMGDQTLRLNYELDSTSTVVDAGGYLGQWAYDINTKYSSTVFVLEPLKQLHEKIQGRFAHNPKIVPLNYAVSNKTQELLISDNTDSSSLFDSDAEATQTIECKDIKEFIEENNIGVIDLLKINIEGAEYDLLERIIELNLLSNIKNLQIQFHRFIPDCAARRQSIQQKLSETHECSWNYEWIWENWKLKN
jgi:FkbM family methyltransferase